MSSTGQIVGGVVGAVVGFLVTWNPYGALQGAAIGAAIGGYLDPPKGPTVQGPRLADQSIQTSTYGAFIPRVYGTVPVSGNLLWLENNKLKETVRKEESGGKGGGSSSTLETFTYSATFAIGLCQGPIAGIKRVWCADKLIYNAGSDDLETIIASNQTSAGWRLYLGRDDQEPDPRYEADVGAGNAPAYRGMAYIVFDDFQLADYSNTLQVAQFKFEVMTDLESSRVGLFSTITEYPAPGGNYETQNPGDYFVGTYYCEGNRDFLTMSKSGTTSEVDDFGIVDISSAFRLVTSGLDSSYFWLKDGSTGSFFEYSSAGISQYQSPYDLTTCHICERNGHIWLSWINDLNNSDPASGRWIGKASIDGFNLSIGPKLDTFAANEKAVTPSGEIFMYYSGVIAAGESGTCNWSIYDENADLVDSGTFTIPVREWSIESSRSCAYIDASGVAHIVFGFTGISSAYGKLFYLQLRISTNTVISSTVIENPGLLDAEELDPNTCRVVDGVVYAAGHGNGFLWRSGFAVGIVEQVDCPLASIITSEVGISSLLSASDIDTTLIVDDVAGYRVSGGTIRAALEPLQGAWPFDVRPRGYMIQCLPRGQSSIETITWEDLGATDGETSEDLLKTSREMDTQLPFRVNIKYLDAAREYGISEQYAERLNTETINRVDREMPIVMNATKAAGVAEVLLFLPWLERVDFQFSLPQAYLHLEPGDVLTVEDKTATYDLRLTEINYTPSGILECKAKLNDAALYDPNAEGAEIPGPPGTIPLSGPSYFIPMDVPVINETIQDRPGFIGAVFGITTGWPGAVLIRSTDQGQTWVDLQGFTGKASIGVARDSLSASTSTMIDSDSIRVDMVSGSLSSITKDQMLGGKNYAAYGVDGRWEIVRFQAAALQADQSYIVSGFVRGERGTEWATGLHEDSDYFILMDDPDLIFMGAAVGSLGLELTYRAITSGQSIDSASDQLYTYNGVNLECLSSVYGRGTRDGSGNFTGTFTRRSRLSSSWWATGVEAPVGETSQRYEIDVMNGSTVERTIAASAPTFSYSAADQTTDFGSAQSSITFRIYQLSGTVGRGYPYEVTL